MEALQLRAIGVERDEEQGDEEQPNELKPVARGLLDKVKGRARKMMAGDPAKALAKALEPVRAALRHWDEIKATHNAKCDDTAYTENLKKAQANFTESQSPENHERLFLAQAVLRERQATADIERRNAYGGSLESEWIRLPDVRDKIKTACALKIEAVKVQLTLVRRKEQAHLGSKYDADDSPLVKEQAGKVTLWEQQLARLTSRMTLHDPILEAQGFLATAKLLLEGDQSTGKKFIHKADGEVYELECVDPINDPDLAEYERTHHLRSVVGGKSWMGGKADFEKVFKKMG